MTILLCTVGGSHQPIIQAIKSLAPDHVCFVCTDRDPETGRPGSISQVTGEGKVIKERQGDEKATLPNIPMQLGLQSGDYRTCLVPADDLDRAYLAVQEELGALSEQFPGASYVADYTGGTKTMSAALVCVALERDDVDLRLVSGPRTNLVKVKSGTGQVMPASVARLRLRTRMAPYLGAWKRFAYQEAEDGLEGISLLADSPDDRTRLSVARNLSMALARWDAFDHAGALDLLDDYKSRVAPAWPKLLDTLRLLTQERKPLHEPARLWDLWHNAERRASQGKFDDAVARLYRLIEWTAQWQLRSKHGFKTADFPADQLPPKVNASPGRDGKIKLGLWQSWQVAAHHVGGPVAELVAGSSGNELRDLLDLRNQSILAHGFKPVQKPEWQRMQNWVEERFLAVLGQLAEEAGLRQRPVQLPNALPESVLENVSSP